MDQILNFYCPICARSTRFYERQEPLGREKMCKGCQNPFTLNEATMSPPDQEEAMTSASYLEEDVSFTDEESFLLSPDEISEESEKQVPYTAPDLSPPPAPARVTNPKDDEFADEWWGKILCSLCFLGLAWYLHGEFTRIEETGGSIRIQWMIALTYNWLGKLWTVGILAFFGVVFFLWGLCQLVTGEE